MSIVLQDRYQGRSPITDTHVVAFQHLASPDDLRARLPVPPEAAAVVRRGREQIAARAVGCR